MLIKIPTSEDRELLLKCIAPGGRCMCGEPAVVRYTGGGDRWSFDWPRCGTCPGTRRTQGKTVYARPMEPHHRALLKLLGDEDAFIAAIRLGYRPPSYDEHGISIDGEVDIEPYFWEEGQPR